MHICVNRGAIEAFDGTVLKPVGGFSMGVTEFEGYLLCITGHVVVVCVVRGASQIPKYTQVC